MDTNNLTGEDFLIEMYPHRPSGWDAYMPRGVKITHKTTGITVACDHERSQHKNRDTAMRGMLAMLTPEENK